MSVEFSRRRFVSLCGFGAVGFGITSRSPMLYAQAAPAPTVPTVSSVTGDLVAANRILARQQIVDAFGHVSVRHPMNRDHFLLARSIAPALVEAYDIQEYDLDGNPIDSKARPSYLERFIHSEVYRAQRDVNAIVHCHTPSLILFGVTGV